VTAAMQDRPTAAARPGSGVLIDPLQLTRMRDMRALTRARLAERAGELLFDRDQFAEILAGDRCQEADAKLARALWLALGCEPADIIRGLPDGLPRPQTSLWLHRNPGRWRLDLDAVTRRRAGRHAMGADGVRTWTDADLADAVARHWLSRDAVHKYETPGPAGRRPSADVLSAICEVLDCAPAELYPGSPPLPDGRTAGHAEMMAFNRGMYAWAKEQGIEYRNAAGRIRNDSGLREAYAGYLATRI